MKYFCALPLNQATYYNAKCNAQRLASTRQDQIPGNALVPLTFTPLNLAG